MCYSVTRTVEDSSGQASSQTQADLDCCNTGRLFTVSNRTQAAVCPFSLNSVSLGACSLGFSSPQGTVQWLFPCMLSSYVLSLAWYEYQVKSWWPKTLQTRGPPSWMLQGADGWNIQDRLQLFFFSSTRFHLCFTEKLGTGQSVSSMTATTDNNHSIFTYLYKKKVFS